MSWGPWRRRPVAPLLSARASMCTELVRNQLDHCHSRRLRSGRSGIAQRVVSHRRECWIPGQTYGPPGMTGTDEINRISPKSSSKAAPPQAVVLASDPSPRRDPDDQRTAAADLDASPDSQNRINGPVSAHLRPWRRSVAPTGVGPKAARQLPTIFMRKRRSQGSVWTGKTRYAIGRAPGRQG